MTDHAQTSRQPVSSIDAAVIAAEATMRHNAEVSAVFVVNPASSAGEPFPIDAMTILRVANPELPVAGAEIERRPYAHVPHWAKVLLESTEGVR